MIWFSCRLLVTVEGGVVVIKGSVIMLKKIENFKEFENFSNSKMPSQYNVDR